MEPAAEQLWRGAYGATAPTLSAARSGQLGEVLMEGELVKQGESPLPAMLMTPPWANRHFVLTGRVALYYESALAQNNKSKVGGKEADEVLAVASVLLWEAPVCLLRCEGTDTALDHESYTYPH